MPNITLPSLYGVSKIVSVKFHKADERATQTLAASLKMPMPNPADKEEDEPHKREETLEVVPTGN